MQIDVLLEEFRFTVNTL